MHTTFKILTGIYPIIAGVTALAISRRLLPYNPTKIIAISIVLFETTSVKFSIIPIAQTLGTAYWAILILLGFFIIRYNDGRFVFLFLIISVATLFTHRLPIVFSSLAFLLIGTSYYLIDSVGLDGFWAGSLSVSNATIKKVALITLVLINFFVLQAIFLTSYFRSAINRGLYIANLPLIFSYSGQREHTTVDATAAVRPLSDIVGILVRNAHGFVLLPIVGICWVIALHKYRNYPTVYILTIAAVGACLISISVISPTAGAVDRVYFISSMTFGIVVGISLGGLSHAHNVELDSVIAVFVALIIISQLVTAGMLPSFPNQGREYLNEQEMAGKEFIHHRTSGPVYSDNYGSHETPPTIISEKAREDLDTQFIIDDQGWVNGTAHNLGYKYIYYRQIKIYRTPDGYWEPTWDIRDSLSATHGEIYSSGNTSLYKKN